MKRERDGTGSSGSQPCAPWRALREERQTCACTSERVGGLEGASACFDQPDSVTVADDDSENLAVQTESPTRVHRLGSVQVSISGENGIQDEWPRTPISSKQNNLKCVTRYSANCPAIQLERTVVYWNILKSTRI